MKCTQTLEVGAYVLGALVPAEREAFERHLAECAICRDEVADLAVLPGLLGRLDFETARSIAQEGEDSAALFPVGWAGPTAVPDADDEPSAERPAAERPTAPRPQRWAGPTVNADSAARVTDPPNSNVVPLLAAAERRRIREKRNRRLVTAGVGLAAACLALVIGLGVPRLFTASEPAFTAMSAAVATAPITAELALSPIRGGTRVLMNCEYKGNGGKWQYKLLVVPKDGAPQEVGNWSAGPGEKFSMDATTSIKHTDIDRIEIQRADGTVLLIHRT